MSNNPKDHPKSSGKPAVDSTDLDAGATILPNKQSEPVAKSGSPPNAPNTPTKVPTVPAQPQNRPASAAPESPPEQSTRERRLDSVPTVPVKPPAEVASMKETAAVDESTVPAGLVAGRKLGDKGRFTLIKELGHGGMGVVWLAHDKNFGEDVALKLLPPEVAADAMALDDMRHETKESRRLTHEHIIRIHDLFEKDGEPAYVAMEFVDGSNLRQKLSEQQPYRCFSWAYLQPLAFALCDALDYAHRERVIHRDLKPANVMLDKQNRLKLADFGIAATMSDSLSRVSQHGQEAIEKDTSGTLLYMSPQQMRGSRPKATDDIYSLGATLYELLTSKPPFYSGGQAAIMYQVEKEPPHPLKERLEEFGIKNEIPDCVNDTILACLAKEPEKRPQTAREVKARLSGQAAVKPEANSAPDVAPGGTVRMSGAVKDQIPAEVLDVDIADTNRLGGASAKASPIAKLVGVCAAILLILGLAWHFASGTSHAPAPSPDTHVDNTTGGTTPPVVPVTHVDPASGSGVPNTTTATPDSPVKPGTTATDPNSHGNGVTPPINVPHSPRLVILPDTISDSVRAQLNRSLQDQLDNPDLGDISLAGYLRDAFVGTKGLTVLERDQLKPAVMEEINLSAGKYGEAQLSKIGHLATADYILVPEIQSVSIKMEKKEILNTPGRFITTGKMKVSFRVVDVATSGVLSSGSIETDDSAGQMGEPADKLQTARDVIAKLSNKAAQAELAKFNHDVLHIESAAAAPAK